MTTSHKSTSSSSHSNAAGLGQHLHGRGQGPGPDLVYDRMAVAMLARREPRWLLRWRAPRCGARRHLCSLRWRRLRRHLAHSSRAALASMLARTTVWCEAAPVQPQAAAPPPLPSSLVAGRAGFYAIAHHGVVRGCTRAASGGGASTVA